MLKKKKNLSGGERGEKKKLQVAGMKDKELSDN